MRIFATEMNKTDKKELYKKSADFLFDVAKLVFAAMVIGGLLKYDLSGVALIVVGLITTGCCLYSAFRLGIRNRKTK